MNTSDLITEKLLKWKVLPLTTLAKALNANKTSTFRTAIKRLKEHETLHTLKMKYALNSKLAYPAENYLKHCGLEKELNIDQYQLTHDSLVSAFCLMMLKLDLFQDADIEDYLVGDSRFKTKQGFYPDAVLAGESEKQNVLIPIELECHQKSEVRIIEKFNHYQSYSTYSDVIFCFLSERVAHKYSSVLNERFSQMHEDSLINFMFCYIDIGNLINLNNEKAKVIHNSKTFNLNDLFKQI